MRSVALLAVMCGTMPAWADDWPQWMGPNRDGVWAESGILTQFPAAGPKVLWRAPVALGYAGPAVAAGKVYVTDFVTDVSIKNDFSKRDQLKGTERILCLDAVTGKEVWQHKYACAYDISYPGGPRCTPTVSGGKVYALGAEGNLVCLNAGTGKVLWSKELKKEYQTEAPIWGFCGHPLVDGQKLICLVGGTGSVAVAFDKDTGKELWKALSSKDAGYCPPTLITAGGTRQLILWHSESINSLDPETGKVYWSIPMQPSYGMSIMAPQQVGEYLWAGAIINKGLMLKLASDKPAATVAWTGDRDTGIYAKISTPVVHDGHLYGVCMDGELRCMEPTTGKRLWATYAPTSGVKANSGGGFLVRNGTHWYIFGETGHLTIAQLTPAGYQERSKAKLLEPTGNTFGRNLVWSHPAFAQKCVFARNDKELVCVTLAQD
jgi:outer membrane protein assembly factor BamB